MADEHRNFRVRKDLGRYAAKHDCRKSASSVRGHNDEIAASLLGGVYDALVSLILFDLQGLANHTNRASFFRNSIQYSLCVCFGAFGVLGKSALHRINPGSRDCVNIERRLHRQCGHLCPDEFGKRQSMAHRPTGKLRAVGWDQNMPIHVLLPIARRPAPPSYIEPSSPPGVHCP